jgi:xylulokinase
MLCDRLDMELQLKKDWLRFRPNRKVAVEPSDASGTLLYNVVWRSFKKYTVTHFLLNLQSGFKAPKTSSSRAALRDIYSRSVRTSRLTAGLPVGRAADAAALIGTGWRNPMLGTATDPIRNH